jgi:hypothetical protein
MGRRIERERGRYYRFCTADLPDEGSRSNMATIRIEFVAESSAPLIGRPVEADESDVELGEHGIKVITERGEPTIGTTQPTAWTLYPWSEIRLVRLLNRDERLDLTE